MAAPVWQALTYTVPPDLAPLVQPLARLLVPLRQGSRLGFALNAPQPSRPQGLKPILDVLEEIKGPQAWPPALLKFFGRVANYYQCPLGQVLAWSLPAGLGAGRAKGAALGLEKIPVAAFRPGPAETAPRAGTQAAALLDRLKEEGPATLVHLRETFPPAGALAKRLEAAGWLIISHRPLVRDLLGRPLWPEPRPEAFTPDQEAALSLLRPAVQAGRFKPFLVYGVTGSGKTELYLSACEAALEKGRQALILTPEIGLCLRLEGLLRDRLGPEKVAVLHSGLSPAARRSQWLAIAGGRTPVVVGARSAIFAPLADPGVICVDEEQDEGYKQEDRLRYHARDLALLRGQEQACPVILGTATPAVTTWHRARQGETGLITLPRRVGQAVLPAMEVVDLRSAGRLKDGFLSNRLHKALKDTIAAGDQAIIFLNRRGFAPAILCPACGKTLGCPACSLSLTWHQEKKRLVCHTCGFEQPRPAACPRCGAPAEQMKPLGLGTEAVAQKLAELEPGFRIVRLDKDTATNPAKLRQVLKKIADREVEVVVGTQMITKGHHFPGISLVGVLLADQALTLPDFRAAERAFILLTQVAGRAGREKRPGRVIVQTFDPEHHAIKAALANRPQDFYAEELAERQALNYPPFSRLVSLRVESAREQAAERFAQNLARHLDAARRRLAPKAQILGPAPAPIAKAQGRYRFLILVKSPDQAAANRILRLGLHQAGELPTGVRLIIDVDPLALI